MKKNKLLETIGVRPFIGLAGVGFAVNILQLTGPLFMMQVYDRVLASGSVPTLVGLAIIAGLAYIFMALLEALRTRIAARMAAVFDTRIAPICYRLNLNLAKFGPDAPINPIADLDRIRHFMASPGLLAIFDIPWIPINLLIIYILHPVLALVTVISSIVLVLFMLGNGLASKSRLGELMLISQKRSEGAANAKRNRDAIIGMGMQDAMLNEWQQVNGSFLKRQTDVADIAGFFTSVSRVGRLALQSVILGVGAFLAIRGEISGGVIIAASILSARAIGPVDQAIAHWRSFTNWQLSLKRLDKAMEALDERQIDTDLPTPRDTLTVSNLASGPTGQRKILIRDINFEVQAGDGLGIVGPSGSGKSTIGKALCSIWPVYSGSIRLDKMQIDHWSDERRGNFIGYLPQNIQLLPGTIAQNIARFSSSATSTEIIAAAKTANAHDLIVSFPDGYDTNVEDDGVQQLSSGQLQRIGLARAFFKNPFLIILDEPNSNLDIFGEKALTSAILNARRGGSIVIIITHRASILAATNKVLVIQNGTVQRFGSSEEITAQITGAPPPAERIEKSRKDERDEPGDQEQEPDLPARELRRKS